MHIYVYINICKWSVFPPWGEKLFRPEATYLISGSEAPARPDSGSEAPARPDLEHFLKGFGDFLKDLEQILKDSASGPAEFSPPPR